ncbi:trypsin-like peptidase domain-containing protein [Patescibacteria group bacterium]|jgi:S1-C subfamily serine protease|nr:trypsin-like peptidase domain-containing protein [Patescibacteria group bacterium]
MINIGKKVTKFVLLWILGLFVLIAIFVGGIYFGKNGKSDLINKGENLVNQRLRERERDVYDLSSCDESTANITEELSDSVVTVAVKRLNLKSSVRGGLGLFGFFNLSPGFRPEDYEEVQQDIGTGFVVGEEKFVITNKHVVSDTEAEYKIVDKDDNEYVVSKIYRDPANDLAILQVDGLKVDSIVLGDSDKIRVGEDVVAIGTALGEFRHTVTTGVISGLGRGITASDGLGGFVESIDNVIQTDAAINPGNSGGPLINRCGEVIGINVAVSSNAENIGFSIPVNVLKKSLDNFENTGKFDRALLGVKYTMISEQAALKNEVPVGAYVTEVIKDSSADEGGIKEGDIIVSFDGVKLTEKSLSELVNKTKIGDRVKVEIYRWDEDKNLELNIKMKEGL